MTNNHTETAPFPASDTLVQTVRAWQIFTMISFRLPFLFVMASCVLSLFAGTALSEFRTVRGVFLGDSLTAGLGIDPSEAYPRLLVDLAKAEGLTLEAVNAGVSGDTTAGGLRRLDWVLKSPADLLFVALGANDGLRGLSVDQAKKNLHEIVTRAKQKYPAMTIVLAGVQLPPSFGPGFTESFGKIFREVAEETNVSLVPFLLEGVAGEPSLNQPDGLHPTAEGQRVMAKTVWEVLGPIVRQASHG